MKNTIDWTITNFYYGVFAKYIKLVTNKQIAQLISYCTHCHSFTKFVSISNTNHMFLQCGNCGAKWHITGPNYLRLIYLELLKIPNFIFRKVCNYVQHI